MHPFATGAPQNGTLVHPPGYLEHTTIVSSWIGYYILNICIYVVIINVLCWYFGGCCWKESPAAQRGGQGQQVNGAAGRNGGEEEAVEEMEHVV